MASATWIGEFRSRIPPRLQARVGNLPAVGHARALVAASKLRERLEHTRSAESALSLALNFHCLGMSIRPWQVPEEVLEMMSLLEEYRPKVVLEIGTAQGGTLFLLAQVADSKALLVSVDLPGGPFGGGYESSERLLLKSFAVKDQRIRLVRADSQRLSTRRRVERLFDGQAADFLFLDADHTYRGVKSDFHTYAPLVRSGGIIAFHDIVPHPREMHVEVDRFWREVRDSYRNEEIVSDWNQGWGGIGILHV